MKEVKSMTRYGHKDLHNQIMLLLNKHFRNAENAADDCDSVVYVHAWLFIKNLIVAAYDVKENDEISNTEIIDNYISDPNLIPKLHEVRKSRNIYEHGNILSLNPHNVTFVIDVLNDLIDYVNCTNKIGFGFAQAASTEKKGKIHFEADPITGISETPFLVHKQRQQSTIYRVGYSAKSIFFSIRGIKSTISKDPFYAVIHNILIRGSKVRESRYLKGLNLKKSQLDRVYVYEVLILNALCEGWLNELTRNIFVCKEDCSVANYALNNIRYFLEIISIFTGSEKKLAINIAPGYFTKGEDIAIAFGKSRLTAVIVQGEDVEQNAKVWLAPKISYSVNKRNVSYYNTLLEELFGYQSFREGQIAALQQILSPPKNNPLIILPTGYGKSLIYQFIAFIQPCITIVVSPTEQLIHDQIENLRDLSVNRISTVTRDIAISNYYAKSCKLNNIKFYHDSGFAFNSTLNYCTPTTLQSESVLELLEIAESNDLLSFIAIDECHQMSIWGHKFEADYFILNRQVSTILQETQIVMFSATASERVKNDIKQQFFRDRIAVIQPTPLDRGNISHQFIEMKGIQEIALDIVRTFDSNFETGSTLDCSSTRDVPALTLIINNDIRILNLINKTLSLNKRIYPNCALYRGEQSVYKTFRLAKKTIILATDEFLAGINVPFLRNLIIIGCPPSKEWFYQETGRVGRYGEDSRIITYLIKGESAILRAILGGSKFTELSNIYYRSPRNEVFDVSNLQFITNDLRDLDEEYNAICRMFKEIKKTVWVSDSHNYGRVKGRMTHETKREYDFTFFILNFIGIVPKWIYRSKETDDFIYSIEVDMDIDHGTSTFEDNIISKIIALSSSNSIRKKYIYNVNIVNSNFSKLFSHVINWFHENSLNIKRQMVLNIYQLIKENVGMWPNSQLIEKNLSDYFLSDSDETISELVHDDIEVERVGSNVTHEKHESIQPKSEDFIRYSDKGAATSESESSDTNEMSTQKRSSNIEHAKIYISRKKLKNKAYTYVREKEQVSSISFSESSKYQHQQSVASQQVHRVSEVIPCSQSDYENSNREASPCKDANMIEAELLQNKALPEKTKQSTEVESLLLFCQSDNELTPSQVSLIIEHISLESNHDRFRVKLEREIENNYYLNLEVTLSVYEMVLDKTGHFLRTRNVISNISNSLLKCILVLIEPKLKSRRKKQIDIVLKSCGKEAYYYDCILRKILYYIENLLGR